MEEVVFPGCCCRMEDEALGGGKPSMNVIYLSTILRNGEQGGEESCLGTIQRHKCDYRCQNEQVLGNMYRCKLTGTTHICDQNCDQRILYDNQSSMCRASGRVFPLSHVEEQAVRGVVRKRVGDDGECGGCKRTRDAHMHPSPFETSFRVGSLGPILNQAGDGMDHMNLS